MRIERIEAIPIRIPLDTTFSGSVYDVTSRCTVVTRIRTSDGAVSEVFNSDNRMHGPLVAKIIQDELFPLVRGESVLDYERIWSKMFPIAHRNRDRKLAMEAIACVDTAVWDLMGKALNVPVHRLLGGHRDAIQIIATGGYYQEGKGLDDLAREMVWLKEQGMAGCKVKVGGLSPEEDSVRVKAAREGGGEDFVIAVDANCGWTWQDAARFARLVEPFDIRWFEEPCHWYDDAYGMSQVRLQTRIPIAAGQNELTRFGVRRLLDARAVDIVNFDASKSGGITEWRRSAALCGSLGVQLAHHEEPHLSLHLLASVPEGICAECFADPRRDPIWAHMVLNHPVPRDGWVSPPSGPGFGIELDWAMVEKYRIH
jgi:D-galactarolactone cycloisomerase